MGRFTRLLIYLGFAALPALADVSMCACDPKRPETLKPRECSLCAEAEKHPAEPEFFLLKDVNPRKPNRWLILPRAHGQQAHPMHELPKATRLRLWKFAVAHANERFGEEWALAYNGAKVRTQCHLHIHVGRFIRAADTTKFKLVRRLEDLPMPEDSGILVRPTKGGYLVLTGEQIMETAIVR